MQYNSFSYVYPTRPKNAAPPSDINRYDNGMMLAQPKPDGSNVTIFTNGIDWRIFNRHGERLTNFNLSPLEMSENLFKCERGRWMVLNGEYLNKAKNDENNNLFNHKLLLFDILVYDSKHLIGSSHQDRVTLLDNLFGKEESEKSYLYQISDNIFRLKTYEDNFSQLFNELTKINLLEGLVLKRKNARLELGLTEDNNSKSMIKFRKPTKNYRF